ncbi:hypothetical protein BDW74DRAFT_181100 [Aspergillus multicolor]|uniref:uncharacterized protein n=1 Tax=Aspergillus multicolor TaxID=41759 RepID=UPI003CCC9AF7
MIYLPLLPTLQTQFSASSQAINMTLTIYIIFQAISPFLFGPPSDNWPTPHYIQIFILPLRILTFLDALLCLWMHGSFYAVNYILAAIVSDIFTNIYHFNTVLTGLSYLPRGVGIISGGYINGRIMNHNYKVTARKHNLPIDRVRGDDMHTFPIELARSRGTHYLLLISTATLVAYGWTVQYEKHFAIPLILQFIQGF